MAPAKRKASELDEAPVKQTQRKSGTKPGRSGKHQAAVEVEPEPFEVYDASDPRAQENAYTNTTTLMQGFEGNYAVKPDTWGQIRQYNNVKCMSILLTPAM